MTAYCTKKSKDPAVMRFLFDGDRLNVRPAGCTGSSTCYCLALILHPCGLQADQTPLELNMQDGGLLTCSVARQLPARLTSFVNMHAGDVVDAVVHQLGGAAVA